MGGREAAALRSSQTTYQIECGPAGSGRICCRWRLRRHRCSVLWGPRSSGWIGSVTASASSRPGTGRSSHTTYHCLCIITESTSCRGCRRLCGHCCMNLRGTRASGMTGSVTWQTKRSTRSRAAAARRREGARSKREGKRAASTFRRFCGNRYLRNVVTQGILLLRAVTHAFLGASEGALDPGVLRSACAGAAKTRGNRARRSPGKSQMSGFFLPQISPGQERLPGPQTGSKPTPVLAAHV